jgi:hypothetical protein
MLGDLLRLRSDHEPHALEDTPNQTAHRSRNCTHRWPPRYRLGCASQCAVVFLQKQLVPRRQFLQVAAVQEFAACVRLQRGRRSGVIPPTTTECPGSLTLRLYRGREVSWRVKWAPTEGAGRHHCRRRSERRWPAGRLYRGRGEERVGEPRGRVGLNCCKAARHGCKSRDGAARRAGGWPCPQF